MRARTKEAARQYASALIQLAGEEASLIGEDMETTVLDDLNAIAEIIGLNAEFEIVINHPGISPAEKLKLLSEVFAGKLSDIIFRLLNLLADRRRLPVLPAIRDEYLKLYRQGKGIQTATLVVAEQPEPVTIVLIKDGLARRLGKSVEMDLQIDSSLIGGAVLQVDNQVFDGSLRGKLRALERAFLAV